MADEQFKSVAYTTLFAPAEKPDGSVVYYGINLTNRADDPETCMEELMVCIDSLRESLGLVPYYPDKTLAPKEDNEPQYVPVEDEAPEAKPEVVEPENVPQRIVSVYGPPKKIIDGYPAYRFETWGYATSRNGKRYMRLADGDLRKPVSMFKDYPTLNLQDGERAHQPGNYLVLLSIKPESEYADVVRLIKE